MAKTITPSDGSTTQIDYSDECYIIIEMFSRLTQKEENRMIIFSQVLADLVKSTD